MNYQPKNYDNLLGIDGLSDQLLKNHSALYQGYVANFNKVNDILEVMEKEGKFATPEYAELNRRLGWEFNGMRLHEYYFENLSKEARGIDQNSGLHKKIVSEFGSYEMWEKDFRAMMAMRGIGWVILYHDAQADRLFNVWINEHDVGHLSGAKPILVMDVFEHAYMLDYGIKRADYIEAIMKAIIWESVEQRMK